MMKSKLPDIAAELAPAREILRRLNQEVQVNQWDVDETGVTGELTYHFDDTEVNKQVFDMVESMFWAAYDLLPDGFTITAKDGEFSIYRMTELEWAEYVVSMEAAAEAEGVGGGREEPWCFRIDPEARVAFDGDGNPVPFCGHSILWFSDNSTPERNEEDRRNRRELVARWCCISPEHVTPISVEEYLANGGKLD